MTAELDLTAAIEAAHAAVSSTWHVAPGPCADCSCGQDAELAVDAALPHIREALAQQVEAAGASIEQAQLAAMGGLLTPLPSGVVAGYAQAARIVRGES